MALPIDQNVLNAILPAIAGMLGDGRIQQRMSEYMSILPRQQDVSAPMNMDAITQELIRAVTESIAAMFSTQQQQQQQGQQQTQTPTQTPVQQQQAQQNTTAAGWQPMAGWAGYQPPPGADTPVDWKQEWSGPGGNTYNYGRLITPETVDPATGYRYGGPRGNIYDAPMHLPGQGLFDVKSWIDQRNQGAVLQGKDTIAVDPQTGATPTLYGPGKVSNLSDLRFASTTGYFPSGEALPGVGPNMHPALKYVLDKTGGLTAADFQAAGVPTIGWASWTPPTTPQQTAPQQTQQPNRTGGVYNPAPSPAPASDPYDMSGYQGYNTSYYGYLPEGASIPAGYAAAGALDNGWLRVNGPAGETYAYNPQTRAYRQI